MELPIGIKQLISEIKDLCGAEHADWAEVFEKTFADTIKNAMIEDENGIFVLTGDIPAMWQRDSTAQVRPYLIAAKDDPETAAIIKKVLKRQFFNMQLDPYANAFNQVPNNQGHQTDETEMGPWVWERKYEIDSLCYPINLAYLYWKNTGDTSIFDENFKLAVEKAVDVMRTEIHHEISPYKFQRFIDRPEDTLVNEGTGPDFTYTGMTWCGFRPSDDACEYSYSIPENMFAKLVLNQLQEIFTKIAGIEDDDLAGECSNIAEEIDQGIKKYGLIEDQAGKQVFAYEVDGRGNYLFMDDANVPDLTSMPYLGSIAADNVIYQNTRKAALSKQNKYYYEGKYAAGLGSPHTPEGYVWHIGLAIAGLTTDDKEEQERILNTLIATSAGTKMMHEGFDPNDPSKYTREWFSWANMMFCELLLAYFDKTISK